MSATSPIQHRDIRSAAKPFKRDRDSGEKWSMGQRPSAGVAINWAPALGEDELRGGSPSQREKVRPMKQWNQMNKSHANKTPKPTGHPSYDMGPAGNRLVRKVDALIDADDHTASALSKSLLELLPQHANNTDTAIQTAVRDHDSSILYSYDNTGSSPTAKGRAVGLDSLVEMAEQKWVAEQTDKIVKGEYEVLDTEGETTVLPGKKGKKGSPKQRAVKNMPAVVKNVDLEEDDGFELI